MSDFKPGLCWACQTEISGSNYSRSDTCPKCRKDTRVCKNCEFFDRAHHNQCRENQADRVVEKERANFCDYFRPSSRSNPKIGQSFEDARSAAESLFKKK